MSVDARPRVRPWRNAALLANSILDELTKSRRVGREGLHLSGLLFEQGLGQTEARQGLVANIAMNSS
ncbi:MAG TPA: hypothetical protein VIJ94_19190, partial [Caulobacteraceae bacterium]